MNLLWQPVGGPKGWHHYCVFPCVIIGVERLLLMRDAIYFNRFSSIVFLPSPLMRKYCKMDQRVGYFCLSLKQQPQSHQWSLKGISQWARQWMESGSMGKKEEKELVPPPWQDRWSWGDQRHRGRQRSRRRIPTWRWWQWDASNMLAPSSCRTGTRLIAWSAWSGVWGSEDIESNSLLGISLATLERFSFGLIKKHIFSPRNLWTLKQRGAWGSLQQQKKLKHSQWGK